MEQKRRVATTFIAVVLILVCLYLLLGLGFHIGWKRAQEACRAEMVARGEFVEPEVFSEPLALAFNLTWWPVYAWANYYHDGTIFATPCTK